MFLNWNKCWNKLRNIEMLQIIWSLIKKIIFFYSIQKLKSLNCLIKVRFEKQLIIQSIFELLIFRYNNLNGFNICLHSESRNRNNIFSAVIMCFIIIKNNWQSAKRKREVLLDFPSAFLEKGQIKKRFLRLFEEVIKNWVHLLK